MFTKSGVQSNSPPAILLGGYVIALTVARSLGSRGIKVYALDEQTSPARYSRFCTWIPNDENVDLQTGWLNWLTSEKAKKLRGAVILPCCDEGLDLIGRHRAKLKNDYLLNEANDDVLLSMLDKSKTYALSKKIDVPCPEIWYVKSKEDILKVADKINYPCYLKPCRVHELRQHFSVKLFLACSTDELLKTFANIEHHGFEWLITEIIQGKDDQFYSYYSYLDENGNPLFHLTKRKLRQHPYGRGIGSYHVTDWNPEVAALGLRFFQGVGLRGIGNVEFKRDSRDGKLKLIECNARMTLMTELLIISGVNLPVFLYNHLVGLPLPSINGYRRDVYAVLPLTDVLAFRDLRRRGEMTLGVWIRSLMHKQHFLYFRWSDPMPLASRLYPFVRDQVKKHVLRQSIHTKPSDITDRKGRLL